MNLRRAGGERRARVDHRRQSRRSSTSTRSAMSSASASLARDDGGDRLADKAHHAVGQHRLADRQVVELVQHRRDRLHAVEIGGGDRPCAPCGAVDLGDLRRPRPALRTKRTQCAAGRSAVKRPCPVISAGSSSRRMARPTQVMPEPLVCARSCQLRPLQRAPHHGAHQIAPVIRRGLDDPPAARSPFAAASAAARKTASPGAGR